MTLFRFITTPMIQTARFLTSSAAVNAKKLPLIF